MDTPDQEKKEDDGYPVKTRDFGFLPIPPHLRYHPDRPFRFSLFLNIAFGFASTFIVSNLYYCQPLLIQFAHSFNVSYNDVSTIPTLVQAGYATGLLFISPLGDLLPRRPLILLTVSLSTALTIPLSLTSSLRVFQALSYLVGISTVTPQILIPLAADLATPERRASAISIVLSGLLFGILIARVLSGIIAEFSSWRVVYYFALAVQSLVLFGAYILLPDYPSKNSGWKERGEPAPLTYATIMKSMGRFAVTEPLLIQCTLVNLASAAAFANFWVTLTFLLGGDPYNYSTLVIGLFGLVGMAGVSFGPVVGYVIDRLVPWYASLVAVFGSIVFQAIQTGAGNKTVAAVVLAAFGLDVFRQMLQVSLTTSAFSISQPARARLNAILILGIFIGQVTGTALGTHLFLVYGFYANAGLNLALMTLQIVLLLARGPAEGRYTWFGWGQGLGDWRRAPAPPPVGLAGDDKVEARDVEVRVPALDLGPPTDSGTLFGNDSIKREMEKERSVSASTLLSELPKLQGLGVGVEASGSGGTSRTGSTLKIEMVEGEEVEMVELKLELEKDVDLSLPEVEEGEKKSSGIDAKDPSVRQEGRDDEWDLGSSGVRWGGGTRAEMGLWEGSHSRFGDVSSAAAGDQEGDVSGVAWSSDGSWRALVQQVCHHSDQLEDNGKNAAGNEDEVVEPRENTTFRTTLVAGGPNLWEEGKWTENGAAHHDMSAEWRLGIIRMYLA